jgi:CDP-diacylglycerol--glycerol-3-phosphate 3-phosphatidyltransferase
MFKKVMIKKNLANTMTFLRIVLIIPLLIATGMKTYEAPLMAFLFFTLGATTDYLDGFFARKYESVTRFGIFFDPVADKLFVVGSLCALMFFQYMSLIGAASSCIIILREIFISSLREFSSAYQLNLSVTRLAKWKTTVQLLGIGSLYGGKVSPYSLSIQYIGEGLLTLAAVLSVVSSYHYFKKSMTVIFNTPDSSLQ